MSKKVAVLLGLTFMASVGMAQADCKAHDEKACKADKACSWSPAHKMNGKDMPAACHAAKEHKDHKEHKPGEHK
ncbi:MAG: hypothetical protein HQL56_16140 [Magnetococcales bacterium]|nr:hypothetical protein [Magnetococcales bacterium]